MATLKIYKDGFEFECKKCGIVGDALFCEHFKNTKVKNEKGLNND